MSVSETKWSVFTYIQLDLVRECWPFKGDEYSLAWDPFVFFCFEVHSSFVAPFGVKYATERDGLSSSKSNFVVVFEDIFVF